MKWEDGVKRREKHELMTRMCISRGQGSLDVVYMLHSVAVGT